MLGLPFLHFFQMPQKYLKASTRSFQYIIDLLCKNNEKLMVRKKSWPSLFEINDKKETYRSK